MLRSMKELKGYTLVARDGEFGSCKDFLFDERNYIIRYMVVDTGTWLPGRKVLISPSFLLDPNWQSRHFPVSLTKGQIEDSPPLAEHEPISLQYQKQYYNFYKSYPVTTQGVGVGVPIWLHPNIVDREEIAEENDSDIDNYLRSGHEVIGYQIMTADEEVGYVHDWIIEDNRWSIPYLVLDTRKWLSGHQTLIPTSQISYISWQKSELRLTMTSKEVKESPEYDPNTPINRVLETRLYDFYGRPHN